MNIKHWFGAGKPPVKQPNGHGKAVTNEVLRRAMQEEERRLTEVQDQLMRSGISLPPECHRPIEYLAKSPGHAQENDHH